MSLFSWSRLVVAIIHGLILFFNGANLHLIVVLVWIEVLVIIGPGLALVLVGMARLDFV